MIRKPFAAFDIDGTLIRGGLFRQLVIGLMERGIFSAQHSAAIHRTLTAWKCRDGKDAYDAYERSLIEAMAHSLVDIPIAVFDSVAADIIACELDHVHTYTRQRLSELKQAGYFLIAISGSQEELVAPFAKKYGFDTWVAQQYERKNGVFTGNIVFTHTNKDKILKKTITEHDLNREDSYAFGDSEGDWHMLAMVDHPVAFNPTKKLLDIAMERGWPVVLERKSVVYELAKGDSGYLLAQAGKI